MVDRPNVFRIFFGDEGLNESGAEATIVPDLPFYVEGLVGVFNGDNEEAFGLATLRVPLITGRVRAYFEPGQEHGILLGMSVASGQTRERLPRHGSRLGRPYKYRPDGWLHPLITVTGEALYSLRQVNVDVDTDGDGVTDSHGTGDTGTTGAGIGGRGPAVAPLRRRPAIRLVAVPGESGLRVLGRALLSFWPSDFLRFRLAYKHTHRSTQTRDAFNLNDSSARKSVDEILFQATFVLGAHPVHPF